MPGREIPLVSGEIYHVTNRGIASQPVFTNKRDYHRFLETMQYYQNRETPIRFSKFLTLSVEERNRILENLKKQKDFMVEFISFCLMPNHFHLLLQQIANDGIAKFISNLTNSYTRYFNTKNKRKGPLFQGKFKAVRIENDNQLLHVVRYIHLNPYTSYVIKNIKDIASYPYSSFSEYLNLKDNQIINKAEVIGHFKTIKLFEKFTLDQADYQRKLEQIKHLSIES